MDVPLPGGAIDISEDYSPAATVVRFDSPLPLLRAPVPSSAAGDEPPVLAFRDAASWRAAWEAAEASLFSQCELPSFGRPVHGLAVQSWRHANASPPGGKACSEGHRPTIKKESNVKNEKWLLVSNRQRRLASSSPRRSAPHLSEMQGSLPRVSLKTQILSSGVLLLGITKHRQHPFVLQIGSTRRILALLPRTTKGATC
ncbi:uncharacterized protein LOC100836805 isoform X2 [Brachypodium distachyon]|uniref:uncharacterized protein LOC100836805 isoform X2 n=1 Tax=Brachypodium distachyon TaxID=15368 RepID=UPI00052FF458|nr:uncharacterized protein LOC100836805 isoform X2 [Brachypodium distachyon]|eukprot:XP_010237558.1 uncharacterized protein LOC100836805 isoform X2 [Brachypodium distachyon]